MAVLRGPARGTVDGVCAWCSKGRRCGNTDATFIPTPSLPSSPILQARAAAPPSPYSIGGMRWGSARHSRRVLLCIVVS
jgi:hypothetical protein